METKRLSPESRGFAAFRTSAPRVAIVTGSAKGIGRGIAAALVQTGHHVVINYHSDAKAAKAAAREVGGSTITVKANVRTPAGAKNVVDAAIQEWGRIDVLVNNVGGFVETPADAMDLAAFEEMYDSNVRTALHCTKAALPHMRKRRSGVIINLGGTATTSLRGNRTYAAYNMAKVALVVFTRSLAQAVAKDGIRVNIVNPGFIRTYAYTKEEVERLPKMIPAGRLGAPSDVASAVAFLASDAASYVTGAVLDVGGGLWV